MIHKHPSVLYLCSFGEIISRFNYYGMQSTLVLYLLHRLLFSQTGAYSIYGVFTTLAFCTPIAGGLISDHLLGYKNSILFGLSLEVLGFLLLGFSHSTYLYLGLSLIILGIGLFKPTNATILGSQYHPNAPHRESGFTLFYMAMNVGAVLGPLVFGLLTVMYGWHITFLITALISFINLSIYTLKKDIPSEKKSPSEYFKSASLALLLVVTLFLLFRFHWLFTVAMIVVSVSIVFIILYIATRFPKVDRNRLFLLLSLDFFAIFYFACSVQVGSSLMVFIAQNIHLTLDNHSVSPAWFAALEPLFVIIAAPLLAPLWKKLASQQNALLAAMRVLGGLLFASLGFVIFSFSAHTHNLSWMIAGIIIGNALLGAGELCIGPTLTSAVTYLAPRRLISTFMGIWFFSIALSGYIGSFLARLTDGNEFSAGFEKIALLTAGIAFLLLIFSPTLKKLQNIPAES